MTNAAALPVIIPALTVLALLPFVGRRAVEDRIGVASAVLLLACALWLCARTADGRVLVLAVGSWAPDVGIVWVVDGLSAVMITLAALSSLATLIYAGRSLPDDEERRWFHPLHQLLVVGVNGAFVTGDLFNLFVFFEVMLVASFVLVSIGGRVAQLRQAFPYVIVNLIASALLLGGVGVVYATAGTVNMASLAGSVQATLPWAFWAGLGLVLVVFALKAALAPLFFWLPDSYPQAALPVSAFFAGLLTKVGVYTLFRAFTLFGGPAFEPFRRVLLVISAATMILGVVGALGRTNIRGILSFHIISQVGYMVFGLALFTPAGVAAGLFYLIHHIVVKTALFLSGGIAEAVGRTGNIGPMRGLARTHPWVGAAFLVPALALAGIPPLSGFWAKAFLVIAGFQAGAYVATAVAIAVSLITLASMLKIWFAAFWGEPSGQVDRAPGRAARLVAPPLALAALSVCIGCGAPLLWVYAERTARALMERTAYVEAVRALTSASFVRGGEG